MRYFAIALWICLIGISALAQANQGAPVGDKSNTAKLMKYSPGLTNLSRLDARLQ
jgi:hypothetical protein